MNTAICVGNNPHSTKIIEFTALLRSGRIDNRAKQRLRLASSRVRSMQGIGRLIVLSCVAVPSLFVFWLVFVGTFNRWELLVGAGVAVVGGFAIAVIERADDAHFRPLFPDLLQAVYIPWLLAQGTYEILWVSLRDLFGGRKAVSAFQIVRFDAGERCNLHDTGRRVLAVAYTTMAPNFIVLGVNTKDKNLLFHQIERSAVPKMTKNLGAIA